MHRLPPDLKTFLYSSYRKVSEIGVKVCKCAGKKKASVKRLSSIERVGKNPSASCQAMVAISTID